MPKTASAEKSEAELQDRAWDLARSIGTCMLVTWDGERQHARPMSATVKRDEHALYFLTDASADVIRQAEKFPTVSAAFADVSRNKYVAVSGEATVENDRERIRALWSPFAKAWWPSADDPAIRVVTIRPSQAELWDSPNMIVATAVMLTAAVTGHQRPRLGDNAKVEM